MDYVDQTIYQFKLNNGQNFNITIINKQIASMSIEALNSFSLPVYMVPHSGGTGGNFQSDTYTGTWETDGNQIKIFIQYPASSSSNPYMNQRQRWGALGQYSGNYLANNFIISIETSNKGLKDYLKKLLK